jgi:hypothetical protein
MKTELVLAMTLGGAACAPPRPNGPPRPPLAQQDTVLKSASLLKRLAEAADGYRDGQDRFVVAAREFPHKVLGVFPTRAQADSIAADSSTGALHYATFGPYRTPPEPNVSPEVDDVDSVVAYYSSGATATYDGKTYDALFWGLPAYDKFVAPYLTSVLGAPYAGEQRQAYKAGELTNSVLPHKRFSF